MVKNPCSDCSQHIQQLPENVQWKAHGKFHHSVYSKLTASLTLVCSELMLSKQIVSQLKDMRYQCSIKGESLRNYFGGMLSVSGKEGLRVVRVDDVLSQWASLVSWLSIWSTPGGPPPGSPEINKRNGLICPEGYVPRDPQSQQEEDCGRIWRRRRLRPRQLSHMGVLNSAS